MCTNYRSRVIGNPGKDLQKFLIQENRKNSTAIKHSSNKQSNAGKYSLVRYYIRLQKKVMVVPYTIVHRGVAVREDTYPEPSVR